MVRGRTAAVVGPARTLLGSKLGQRIDSFDVVVRFNDALDFLTPDLAGDIGTRVDVLYANQVVLGSLRPASLSRVHDLVCTNNSLCFTAAGDPRPTCLPGERRRITDVREALARARATTRLRVVYAASDALSQWMDGNWPRTGLVGIVDLLAFGVGRLFITGMTFYHGGGHLLTPPSTTLHPQKNRDGSWARSADGVGHDSYLELEILKILVREFGAAIEMDEPLTQLVQRTL